MSEREQEREPDEFNVSQSHVRRPNPYGNGQLTVQPAGGGAFVSTEQQRALGQMQARIMMAAARPRNRREVTEEILNDCTRVELAQEAQYDYVRGGQRVTGPSIRLMEAIAQRWRNLDFGIRQLSRDDEQGVSEMQSFAWDLETNVQRTFDFQVKHIRDRSASRGGPQKLTDERDIYELVANMGQRRTRSCLEALIPSEVTNAAVEQCNDTLQQKADVTVEGRKNLLAAFTRYGVTQAHIEAFCQCRLEAIRPAQIVRLRSIFTSLKDGEGTPGVWFRGWQPPPPPGRPAQTGSQLKGDKAETQQPPAEPPGTIDTVGVVGGSRPPTEPPTGSVQPPVAETSQQPGTDKVSGPAASETAPEGNEETEQTFEHVLLNEQGEPIDGEVHLDPLAWAQQFLAVWNRATRDGRADLLFFNADALVDVCAMSPEADALLDGLDALLDGLDVPLDGSAGAPPASETSAVDESERASSEILQHLPTLTTAAELIAYSKSPAVMMPIKHWQDEGRTALVTSVKSAFTARLETLRSSG